MPDVKLLREAAIGQFVSDSVSHLLPSHHDVDLPVAVSYSMALPFPASARHFLDLGPEPLFGFVEVSRVIKWW